VFPGLKNGRILVKKNSGLDEAKSDPATPGPRGLLGPKTYRYLSLVLGSFGLVSLPLTERSVLRDLGVTSLITIGGPQLS
jgi:hypothetical protein